MSDLRQGVTGAGRDVFDLLDKLRTQQGDLYPCQHLDFGRGRAQQALRTVNAVNRRTFAIEAAAHLILAIEINDAMLAEQAA